MDFELYGIGAVALCVALVQLAKMLGFPEKYAPALAVAIGIIEGFVAFGVSDPAQSVVLGLAAGLAAVGLFSGAKNVIEGVRK